MSRSSFTDPPAVLTKIYRDVSIHRMLNTDLQHDLVLCVCVCLFRDALLLRTKPEDMVALLHTNLLGTMLTCRAALRSMLHTQGAAIVNIGTDRSGPSRLHE